jgi:uncharacterized membrane protein
MNYDENQKIERGEEQELVEEPIQGNWNFMKAVFIITIVGFSAIVMISNLSTSPSGKKIYTPLQDGNNLIISESSLNTKAKFYSYTDNNVKIYFFAMIGSDDEVHIAFDACDACYPQKKGYSQAGTNMVCNNCGNVFSITSIGTENLQGGCWPSHLPVLVNNGEISMTISDIVLKRYMFA